MGGRRPQPYLDNYRRHLIVERNLHPHTVQDRLRCVSSWLIYLGRRRKSPVTATKEDAQDWWAEQLQRFAPNTCASMLSHLRDYYNWLNTVAGVNAPHWFGAYKVRRRNIKPQHWLSEEEMWRLLKAASGDNPKDIRARALTAMLWSTGSRISAMLATDVSDLRPDRHRLFLRKTKTGEQYEVVVTDVALHAVLEYIELARPILWSPQAGDALWIGDRGRRWNRESARQAVRHLCAKAGLVERISPHDVRRTAALQLLENGADLREIQAFLGHATLRSTERYIRFYRERELQKAEARHPMQRVVAMPSTSR